MKLLCVYSRTHTEFAEKGFLPSIGDEYEIIARVIPDGPGSGKGTFMEQDWRESVEFKCRQILYMIERYPGESFVYSDVDLIVYGPTKLAVLKALADRDIVCHLDDPAGNLCTGFMAMRAGPALHRLWTLVLKAIQETGRDQLEFNRVIRAMKEIRWGYLPESFFGAGTFSGKPWKSGETFHITEKPLVFHANWCVGVARKMELLKAAQGVIAAGPAAIRKNNRLLRRARARSKVEARRNLGRGSKPLEQLWKSLEKPRVVRLDASTACQLKCPACPTAGGVISRSLGGAFLKIGAFRNFVAGHPGISQIELSNWGEVFLNPDLPDILWHAYRRGIRVTIQNGANLNKATPEALEALVRCKVRHLSCSIDGASQETYAAYRVQGDFERVIGHIRQINALKKRFRSPYPALRWQFIAFGHNEHEIEKARAMAQEMGMEFFFKLSWDDLYGQAFSPVRDRDLIRRQTGHGAADRSEYTEKTGKSFLDAACHQMWQSPQINHDGRLLGCCINHQDDFGNVFEEGLDKLLSGEKMTRAREMLMGLREADPAVSCSKCSVYLSRKQRRAWVRPEDLKEDPVASRLSHWIGDRVGLLRWKPESWHSQPPPKAPLPQDQPAKTQRDKRAMRIRVSKIT